MRIKEIWRRSAECLAAQNDDAFHAEVFGRRDRGSIDSAFVAARLALADEEHLRNLTAYVSFLIWGKLTQKGRDDGQDSFLGITDLSTYLKEVGYPPADVEPLMARHRPTRLGDLRVWLCAKRGAARQLYSHAELDLSLLEADIDLVRWQPPPGVLAAIRSSHRGKQETSREIEKWRRKPDRELREHVPRGLPARIQQWAMIIARQLIVGSCNCPERSYESARLEPAGETRCRHAHFLSELNLAAALRGKLPNQKAVVTDVLGYIERAVVEKLYLKIEKTFANTMLANEFVTPGGGKLRQMDWNGATVLTEAGRELLMDHTEYDGPANSNRTTYPCLGCWNCRRFLNGTSSDKNCHGHPLHYGTIDAGTDGEFCQIKVKACQAGHLWTGKSIDRCPICEAASMGPAKTSEFFAPENSAFDGIEWCAHVPNR